MPATAKLTAKPAALLRHAVPAVWGAGVAHI